MSSEKGPRGHEGGKTKEPRDPSILLLDDSPAILQMLKDLLASLGYRNVKTAKTVKDGLKAFKESRPEVVFLDLMLSETTSGLDFLKEAMVVNPKAKVIVTSALAPTSEAVVMAVSLGAREYVGKPLRKEEVGAVLEKVLKGDEEDGPGMFYG